MPKFFINKNQIDGEYISIVGEDAHHISRSLRMAVGEKITVSDGEKFEYECVLEDFSSGCVKARIIDQFVSRAEPEIRFHLYQALPKGEKLDLIIQKVVECGAYDITLFESERCIAKVKGEAEGRKSERRNKIALEAAKQCGRGIIPSVNPTLTFEEMLKKATDSSVALFCYEGEGTRSLGEVLKQIRKENNLTDISIIIGSEGGFSISEVERAEIAGCYKIGLGKRILRTETAAIMALSCLVYEFELS